MSLLKEFSSAVGRYTELGELTAERVVFKKRIGYFRKRPRDSGGCRGCRFTNKSVVQIEQGREKKPTLSGWYNFVLIVGIERVVCTRFLRDSHRGEDSSYPF